MQDERHCGGMGKLLHLLEQVDVGPTDRKLVGNIFEPYEWHSEGTQGSVCAPTAADRQIYQNEMQRLTVSGWIRCRMTIKQNNSFKGNAAT